MMDAAVGTGSVYFHETTFSSLRHEGSALFLLHWLEASADRSVLLDIDWLMFEADEAAGGEVCVAARSGGLLVGYAVYILGYNRHYRGRLVAQADAFFLRVEDRHGWVGVHLIREAERLLEERGVRDVLQRVKLHVQPGRGRSDLGPMFRYLGYQPIETIWRKVLS